jgi:hypothetical protein
MDNVRLKNGIEQYLKVLDNHIAQISCNEVLDGGIKSKKIESLESHKESVLKELESL